MRRRASYVPLLAALALAGAAALAGCGDGATGPATVDEPDLSGQWVLVSGTDVDGAALLLVPGRDVTLIVDRGKGEAGGISACNHYFATLTQEGNRVAVSGVGSTEMACEPDVMDLETRYHAALGAVDHAARTADTLTLSGAAVELVYETVAPTPDADLVGTTWRLESLLAGDTASSTVSEPDTGSDAWLMFGADGRLSGSTGCAAVSGAYALDDERVTVDLAAEAGSAACADALEAQHRHVRDVLGGGFTQVVEGNTLTLTAPDGRGLGLRADGADG